MVFLTFSFPLLAKDALAGSGTLYIPRLSSLSKHPLRLSSLSKHPLNERLQTLTTSVCSCIIMYTLPSGNHTYAAIKGGESYELLSQGLGSVIAEVNQVITKGSVTVDGREVKLEFYLGSDYKVLFCDHVVSNTMSCCE